jgi:hypothetical protein
MSEHKDMVGKCDEHDSFNDKLGSYDSNDFLPGTFGCHEALDRCSILCEQVDSLSQHPAIVMEPEWRKKAVTATNLLAELYQDIGRKHMSAI